MVSSLSTARVDQTMEERHTCFAGFGKFVGKRITSPQEELSKLVESGQFEDLEKLYQNSQDRNSRDAGLANILMQILQIQDVQTSKEYTLHGYTFKVFVIEDTEL